MTDPAPKPMPCPNPECRYEVVLIHRGGEAWTACKHCHYTGPRAWGEREKVSEVEIGENAIRLHNLICRPQQSAEPVAWMKIIKTYYHNHGVEEVDAEFDFTPDCPGEGWTPLFAASPGPSELVEEMEALEKQWRDMGGELGTETGGTLYFCADDLRALITRHRGKS